MLKAHWDMERFLTKIEKCIKKQRKYLETKNTELLHNSRPTYMAVNTGQPPDL